ncbi:MAG: hypothetical protein M1816_003131 [Peltula sp. TS41687]|nr:MAG: hypothetical protein M1816_003131 [Peltula sp. TS41687]
MQLVHLTTTLLALLTTTTTTLALPSNPLVNTVNGMEKYVNAQLDALTDYSSIYIAPHLAPGELTAAKFLNTLIALGVGFVALESPLGYVATVAGAVAFVTGTLTLTFILEEPSIHLGSESKRIINLAQSLGLKVNVVPNSQKEALLRSWATQHLAAATTKEAQKGRSST